MANQTKNIATITLHASYNFGSVLQAYALQEFVKSLSNNINYEIINLRTPKQKAMYKNIFNQKNIGIKKKIFLTILNKYKNDIKLHDERFEKFINEDLNTTKEFSSFNDLKNNCGSYDYYIAGSDQIWSYDGNLPDFDWSYLLGFTKTKNKISYSASFGPFGCLNENIKDKNRFFAEIDKFKYVSVRDDYAKKYIENGIKKEAKIHIDPTMLLNSADWKSLSSQDKPIFPGKYIFLYQRGSKEAIKIAKDMSKKLNIPVVVPKFPWRQEWQNGFKLVLDAGPKEFINLVQNAQYVVGFSYHACIFAIIFNKKFFACNVDNDNRTKNLLKTFNLEDRALTLKQITRNFNYNKMINYKEVNKILEKKQFEAKEYLKEALDI